MVASLSGLPPPIHIVDSRLATIALGAFHLVSEMTTFCQEVPKIEAGLVCAEIT